MSNCPQFTSAPPFASFVTALPPSVPPVPPDPPGPFDDGPPPLPPPEETQEYVEDIRDDLFSNDPERRLDGMRRLCVQVIETGQLGFLEMGQVARLQFEGGLYYGLAELALCLAFSEVWPPEVEPSEVMDPIEDVA